MQLFLSSLIVFIAALYIIKQWLPHQVKQRLMPIFGKSAEAKKNGVCDSCSSCGSCGSDNEKDFATSAKKIRIVSSK